MVFAKISYYNHNLTHCSLVDFSTLRYWKSPFAIKVVFSVIFLGLFSSGQKLLLANSGDPDQTLHYAASDLGLHCLPMYPFQGFPTTMG